MLSAGIKVMTKSDTSIAKRKGRDFNAILSIFKPVIEAETYKQHATGGVTKAMHNAVVMTTPKCTGFIP